MTNQEKLALITLALWYTGEAQEAINYILEGEFSQYTSYEELYRLYTEHR